MRTVVLYIVICMISSSVIFVSCKKFDEGKNFSLKSEENRLTNTWFYQSVLNIKTNQIQTSGFNGWSETFKKDKTYIKVINYIGTESQFNGSWDYDGENTLTINYTMRDADITETYEIIRLSNNDLCLLSSIEEKRFIAK